MVISFLYLGTAIPSRQSDSASVSHTNRIDSEAILYRKKGSTAYSQYNSKDSEVDTVTDDSKLRNSDINLNFWRKQQFRI